MRSTPGPQATRLSSSPHSGQAFGGGITWPQWWQASRRISRCSTIQAVQFGHWKRWPQWRQRVSGAKPRRLRNSSDCSPRSRLASSSATRLGRQPAPARRRVLRQVDGADFGHARTGEAMGERHLAIAADLDHVPRLDRRRRGGQDHRNVLELAAHHRDVAGVILDAVLLLEARLVRLVDDDQAEVRVGQEQRRAGADRDLRLAASDRRASCAAAATSAGPNARRPAAQPKRASKRFRNGSVSAISGSRTSACLPCRRHSRDRLEIDFGLARSGHAVEQDRVEALADRRGQAGRRFALLVVELGRREIGIGAGSGRSASTATASSAPALTSPRITASLTSAWSASSRIVPCRPSSAASAFSALRSHPVGDMARRPIFGQLPRPFERARRRQDHPQHRRERREVIIGRPFGEPPQRRGDRRHVERADDRPQPVVADLLGRQPLRLPTRRRATAAAQAARRARFPGSTCMPSGTR